MLLTRRQEDKVHSELLNRNWVIFQEYIQNHRKLWEKLWRKTRLLVKVFSAWNNKYIELYFNINIQIVGGNSAGFDDNKHSVTCVACVISVTFCSYGNCVDLLNYGIQIITIRKFRKMSFFFLLNYWLWRQKESWICRASDWCIRNHRLGTNEPLV